MVDRYKPYEASDVVLANDLKNKIIGMVHESEDIWSCLNIM